jgi:hypothetical protein
MFRSVVTAAVGVLIGTTARADLLGPSGYLSFADSPFNGLNFSYFHLEDFEDHLFNVPGVSASAGGVVSVVFGPAVHDSVDLDDGLLDGSGLNGDDFFTGSGSTGINFTFDAGVLGALPTHAGIVWTDGGGTIRFEAFDENGVSLGTVVGNHANTSVSGETAEDRFYGVINAGGISKIFITNTSGGMEVDHLQYGQSVVPEPVSLNAVVLGGAVWWGRRRR